MKAPAGPANFDIVLAQPRGGRHAAILAVVLRDAAVDDAYCWHLVGDRLVIHSGSGPVTVQVPAGWPPDSAFVGVPLVAAASTASIEELLEEPGSRVVPWHDTGDVRCEVHGTGDGRERERTLRPPPDSD